MFIQLDTVQAAGIKGILEAHETKLVEDVRFLRKSGEFGQTLRDALEDLRDADYASRSFKDAISLSQIDGIMELKKVG